MMTRISRASASLLLTIGALAAPAIAVDPAIDHQLDDSTARTDLLRRSAAFLAANLK